MINVNAVREMSINEKLAKVEAELAELLAKNAAAKAQSDEKKNHKTGKPSASRKYMILEGKLKTWGNVPRQQSDIAEILLKNFRVMVEFSEAEAFNAVIDGAGDYVSIYKSVQDPTYLFRYYRGLKNNGKQAGFIARGFLRVIDVR